jgi:indole-3-glycerol phosphate synthase
MQDILSEIVANKRFETDLQKQAIPQQVLEERAVGMPPGRSLRQALAQSASGIIAEFKRRSPSKGWIHQSANPAAVCPAYEQAGAAALSILTDEKYFGGSLKDLINARPLVALPILRKDFIVDEYQLYQAKLTGADAVLLIAAALPFEACNRLTAKAHELGLEVLLELHSEPELDYIRCNPDVIGINNRNLGSFHTAVENSFRLAELLPREALLVSESGISHPDTVRKLRSVGFRGFLIGENFMRTEQPGESLRLFIQALES